MTKRLGIYAGLDLSLAGTAGVLVDQDGDVISMLAFSATKKELKASTEKCHILLAPQITHRDGRSMWRRTVKVAAAVREWIRENAAEECFFGVEDHAYGAKGTSIYQLGHLHGLIRRDLQDANKKWILIAPTELKSAVTGSGTAKKEDMCNVPSPHLDKAMFGLTTKHNVVDAYWLAQAARAVGEYHRTKKAPEDLSESFLKVLLPNGKKKGLIRKQVLP